MKVFVILLALAAVGSCSTLVRSKLAPMRSSSSYSSGSSYQEQHPVRHEFDHDVQEIDVVSPGHVEERVAVRGPSQVVMVKKHPGEILDKQRQAELEEEEEERIAQLQSENAKYTFASAVDDGIMDHSHVRQESRDGNKVTGSYSYSDGFVKRTVNYEADENGYRVVSEEFEPIGDGPTIDLVNGKADVHTQYEGIDTQYSINAHDIVMTSSTELPHALVNDSRSKLRVAV